MDTHRKLFNNKILFLLFVALLSCNTGTLPIYFENKTMDMVKIDILVPADTGIKHKISRLGLLQVNYSPNYQKITYTFDDEETNITTDFIYDAIQSNLDGFFAEAEEKTAIEIHELSEVVEPQNPFDFEKLKIITDSLDFDALIFINNAGINFDINAEIPDDGFGFHQATINCKSTFYYTLVYPEKGEFETIRAGFQDKFAGDANYIGSKAAIIYGEKKIKEALPYMCYETGKRAIYELFPIWATVERKFYGRASGELRQARKLVNKGLWDEAISIWESNKDHENKVIAKHCRFNLILAEELTGSLEEAAKLAKSYYNKYNEDVALKYAKVLERRLLQKQELGKQL